MKRGAKLAVLLVALLVLVGAWFLAESLSRRQEDQQAEEALQALTDISVGPEEDVTALAWDYFGDKANLAYRDGAWVNADDETCPIDQDAVHALAEAVSSVQATHAIEGVTDMQPYGLADSGFTIVAGTAERVVTYNVGSQASDGSYYVRLDGGDTVYTDPGTLAPAFQIALDDVLLLESAPADIGQLTGLTVQTEAGGYSISYLTDGAGYWYTDAFPWALLGEDGAPSRPLDTEKAEELCELVTGVSLTECESWKAKAPAEYGLDTPQGTARVDYLDENGGAESFTLEFGDYKDDEVYVRLAGSDMVYRVAGAILDGLMYPDFDAMEPLNPGALDRDKLQSVFLELDGDTRTVTRSVSTPQGEDEQPEDIYTMGEKSLDAKKVADWLDRVYDMTADSRTEPTEGREMLFRFTFRQDSESYPEVTMEFRAYDSVHDLCIVNGTEHYLVSRTEADGVKEAAQAFLIDLPVAEG